MCGYEKMFSIGQFYPRTRSIAADTSVGLIYKRSLKEKAVKSQGSG